MDRVIVASDSLNPLKSIGATLLSKELSISESINNSIPCGNSLYKVLDADCLLVIDYLDYGLLEVATLLGYIEQMEESARVLVINAPSEAIDFDCLKKLASYPCVFGIVSVDQISRDIHKKILKVIKEIAEGGNYWFSRRLTAWLCETYRPLGPDPFECLLRKYNLSKSEKKVLTFLNQGLNNKDIARKVFVSEHTVKSHLYSSYKKLGVGSRLEAVRLIAQHFH